MVQLLENNMTGAPYLCVFHLATAGQQGAHLGSDEEEIIALMYVIIDKAQQKVIGVQQYIVKPTTADTTESFLSPDVALHNSMTEDLVRKGLPLDVVITQFDSYLRTLKMDPSQMNFVTDGELPLRQCLHPEACFKKIELPDYYNTFIDLRKDFTSFYSPPEEKRNIIEMIETLSMDSEVDPEYCLKDVKDLVNLTLRLLSDGHVFNILEHIMINLEPGLCSKDEEVDPNVVVRARGLPWQSSDGDIAKFFRGLNIEKGGVALCLSPLGRRNGEALVRFVNQTHREMALRRHKHHMGTRYIEVYKSTGEEFVNVAGGNSTEAHEFLSRGGQVIVRMRGLPYECTADKVIEFFRTGVNRCEVLDGEDGVLFVKKADGRATGDAFVLFANESDAPVALSKHRELIGSRYIELFRSTTAEVQQVLNRTSQDVKSFKVPVPIVPPLPAPTILPQHVITCGIRKDCIRLRGLPYEAQVEHILEFLGDYSKSIVYQGVHMVFNSQGQPSGEAFIQMDSETSAFHAANNRHHQTMTFGKKQRYVEVFQCSGDDMNSFLTAGQVSPKATPVLSSGGTLVPGPSPPFGAPFAFPANAQLIASPLGPGLASRGPPQFSPYGSVYLWPYPSPPISPTSLFGAAAPQPLAIIPSPEWSMDFVGGSPPQIINTQPINLQGIHSVVA